MVRLTGFEPAAHGVGGHCSIQLSYRRKLINIVYHNFVSLKRENFKSIFQNAYQAKLIVDFIRMLTGFTHAFKFVNFIL